MYQIIAGLITILMGIILIIFREEVSKILAITMIKGIIKPKDYDSTKSNIGIILMGASFIIIGILVIFFPGFFS